MEKAYFGGGCFWCTEAAFKLVPGVKSVEPGYAGGEKEHPTYDEICRGDTKHAEVVEVSFDPEEITYVELLNIFFGVHDPGQKDRQGNDVGSQYRSIILYTNEDQKNDAEVFIEKLAEDGSYPDIYTELVPFLVFWPAEEYHKDYFEKHPEGAYCQAVVRPKVEKVKELLVAKEDK